MTLRKRLAACTVVLAAGLLTAGCDSAASTTRFAAHSTDVDCAPYAAYTGHAGTTVSFMRNNPNGELNQISEALRAFSDCTGIRVEMRTTVQLEKDIVAGAESGNLPDIAVISQPGIITQLARNGKVAPVPADLPKKAGAVFSKDLTDYVTVDGTLYAVPYTAFPKSLIWYAPPAFATKGYQTPGTWDELLALSDRIVADGGRPWCEGWESGGATGWPGTDWIEEIMLRLHGPAVYDQWINHTIPFNDPKVAAAFDEVGKVLKNDAYVHGGSRAIATRAFATAAPALINNQCYFYAQASWYGSSFPRGTKIAADGDIYAFYNPPMRGTQGKPVEAGGDYFTAFSKRPEVVTVLTYLSSLDFIKKYVLSTGGISASTSVPLSDYTDPVNKLSAELLRDPAATIRFDASDLMPGAVGAGTFWTEITKWISGQSTAATLDAVERSWPKG